MATETPAPEPDAPVPPKLHECARRDAELLKRLGWKKFVLQRRAKGDFTSLDGVHHPAKRLLKHYKSRGAPVKVSTEPWSRGAIDAALQRGAHRSCMDHIEFLHARSSRT